MKIGSKITIGSVATMLAMVAGIWAIDDRYVSAQEMQQSMSQIHLRIDVEKKRTLEREYYEFLKLVAQNPDNEDLKEHLQAINEEKEELEKRRQFAVEQGANDQALKVLDKLCVGYESNYYKVSERRL